MKFSATFILREGPGAGIRLKWRIHDYWLLYSVLLCAIHYEAFDITGLREHIVRHPQSSGDEPMTPRRFDPEIKSSVWPDTLARHRANLRGLNRVISRRDGYSRRQFPSGAAASSLRLNIAAILSPRRHRYQAPL